MLTAVIIVCVCLAASSVCWWIYTSQLRRGVDLLRAECLSVRHENDKYSKFLHNQKCRFDDLVARNARNYTSPIRGAKAVDTQGAWSVYATLQSGADQLIARFDTPDPEYNRILASDLCEKLNEKPV